LQLKGLGPIPKKTQDPMQMLMPYEIEPAGLTQKPVALVGLLGVVDITVGMFF